MVASLGAEFQASAIYDNVPTAAPAFDMPEPEVTTTVTINPDLLNGADGACLLPGVAVQAMHQSDSLLGGIMSAVENLTNDVCEAGQQLMGADLAQEQIVEVGSKPVLDTFLTAKETQYTQEALKTPVAAPTPNMLG